MRVSAIVTQVEGRWLAQCEEVDRSGDGDTPEEALRNLRVALQEYFGHSEAVAPPKVEPPETIEIIVIDAPAR